MTAKAFTAEERKAYIGASEIAAVMGRDPYRTPLAVFNEKTGRTPAFTGNAHTERGNHLEAVAADFYTERTGIKLRRDNTQYEHPDYPFIVGHIDRRVIGENRIVEIKCPSSAAFRTIQHRGLPENYIIQAQVYMGLTKTPKLTWVIFCADVWDAAVFDIEFDDVIYQAAVREAVKFWTHHIVFDVPPEFDAGEVKDNIEIAKIGGSVLIREDEAFVTAMQMKLEARRLQAEVKELDELATQRLKSALDGVYGVFEGGGGRLHYQQQAGRKTLNKKALAEAYPEIDLSKFEKQGEPFEVIKIYELKN